MTKILISGQEVDFNHMLFHPTRFSFATLTLLYVTRQPHMIALSVGLITTMMLWF